MKPEGEAGAVAFAASELDPLTPGGIGRVVALLTEAVLETSDDTVHLFLPEALARAVPARPRVVVWGYDASSASPLERSRAVCRAIARVSEQVSLRWIEFPDFQGLGFAALHHAALTGLPGAPELRVRVHGPASLIAFVEGQRFDGQRLLEFDLERSALHLAHLCLAPSGAVRDVVADFFRLDRTWREAVCLHLPPRGRPSAARPTSGPRSVIFPTKLQAIKRPDLFIEALWRLPEARPLIAAHRNPEVEGPLFANLSPDERQRFRFVDWSRAEREQRFAGQVVVVPSDFETLSLAAWEAAAVGAHVVGNVHCPAFREGPLRTWPGFVGFDGTPGDLARAIADALAQPPPAPLSVPAEPMPPSLSRAPLMRALSEADVALVTGPVSQWASGVATASTPWVLLAAEDDGATRRFRAASAAALARDGRLDAVASLGPGLTAPSAQWLAPGAPAGAVAISREFARRALGWGAGARAVTASAIQAGLRVAFDLERVAWAGADEAPLPPPWLDAHAVLWRARDADRPPLRAALAQALRRRVGGALGRLRTTLRGD